MEPSENENIQQKRPEDPTSPNNKKQRKYRHTLTKQTGAKCTIFPTKHIGVCNSGLVNGLSEEEVYEYFSKYGNLEQILMLPGKSCCFVSFQDIQCSTEAFNNINGVLNIAQYSKPVYLSFVENIPENLIKENLNHNSDPPQGLIILENFITENEEQTLLALNDFNQSGDSLKHRQVRHYGYEFKYDINNVDLNCPLEEKIPKECDFLWKRLRTAQPQLRFVEPDQLTVNCYKPGHGIPPHVDTHSAFEDPIFILSLGSDIVMDFKNDNGEHRPLSIPQRSFVIMSGESRYAYTHGITPRKLDILRTKTGLTVFHRTTRVSFTFRKVRGGNCDCKFYNKCDSYQRAHKKNYTTFDQLAEHLEETHVHEVYENIAHHFNETRHKPWPNVLDFIRSFEVGSVVVDVGCGNGKYMTCGQNIFQIGLDTSISLLNVCREKQCQVILGNCLRIPLIDNVADGAICIAVIHHLSTEERRSSAIQELLRILKVGGKVLIYVWAKEQKHRNGESSYLKQDRNRRCEEEESEEKITLMNGVELPIHTNRTEFKHQDLLVPWKLNKNWGESSNEDTDETQTFLRFYHVFKEGELENLCVKFNANLLNSYYEQGNWCAVLEKK